jgi:4-amino-4-deoxy-L-arabinose transferase-like glycosyltransferase
MDISKDNFKRAPFIRIRMDRHLAIALFIALLSSIIVYSNFLVNLNPFGWDEAYRANPALAIGRDALRGDINAFIEDSNRQMFYPPGSSWIIGLFFILFGESMVAARLIGLMFYSMSVVLIYILTKAVTKKDTPLNLLPSLLLSSSPFVLLFAALSMLETAGMFFTLLIFYLYIRAIESSEKKFYFLTGLAGAAAFMLKYNYGITPMAALLLSTGFTNVELRELNPKTFANNVLTKNNLIMFLTMAIICGLWLSSTMKVLEFGNAVLNRGYDTRQPITFYITSLTLYTFSPILYLVIIASTVYAFRYIRDEKIKHLLIFIVLMFFLLTLHDNKIARLLMTVTPIMFVLVGYMTLRNYGKICSLICNRIGAAILILLITISVMSIPSTIHYVNSQPAPIGWAVLENDASIGKALNFIYLATKDFNTNEGCVFGGFNELSFHLIYFYHNLLVNEKQKPFPDFCRPKFFGQSFSYGVSPDYVHAYQTYLSNLLKNESIKYAVTIQLNQTSRYFHSDYINYSEWEINYVRLMENQQSFRLSDNKSIDGISIKIYLRA